MKETTTERISKRIKLLLSTKSFITWDMIEVVPYYPTGRHRLTYEGRIVFDIMSKYNNEYISYREKFDDKSFHGNSKGFYNGILMRRFEKIEKIKEKISINYLETSRRTLVQNTS